ncbi:MAG: PAS domain-containing protein, partial [Algicola sp.]|nr:PAS domain-containing protein [Algicola sp.]
YGGGLNQFDHQTQLFTRYKAGDAGDTNRLSHNMIKSIYQDSKGIFWIGTEGGLNRFDAKNNTFKHFRKKHGLNSERVNAVLSDNNGNLWLGEVGISYFDIQRATVKSNIAGSIGCSTSQGAYFQASDGQIFFGSSGGYCAFYPQNAMLKSQTPTVVFSDFRLLNKTVPIVAQLDNEKGNSGQASPLQQSINTTESITLNHKQNVLSFEFSALHYVNPTNNQYKYKLEGFNSDWVETSSKNRRATYTNLAAGHYTFVVKASNNEGVWNEQGRSIELIIKPAPWRTWWAYMAYCLIVLAISGLFGHQRMIRLRAIKERNKQLSLALWGSGDQMWDWDKKHGIIQRRNILSHFSFAELEPLPGAEDDLARNIHQDDKHGFLSAVGAHIRGDESHFEASYRLRDKTGEWRWVLDRGKITDVDEQGQIIRVSGTLQDIHNYRMAREALRELNETLEQQVATRTQALQDTIDQLKAAQQQLVEAEKMAALGNLVAGVAHEVNTPLGSCITMVSLQIEKLKTLEQDKNEGTMTRRSLNDYIEATGESQALVESNLHRAAELIQSFKKVAVEQTEDRLTEVVFHDYLADILSSIVPGIKDKQVEIKLLSGGDWMVKTWAGAWWQLISVLVENSLSHGFLIKDSGQITLSATLEQGRLIFVYRDDGGGMTPRQIDKMYEPFYTTARGRGSTGLGMHIVYNLVVHKLAGSISCQSEPGQ